MKLLALLSLLVAGLLLAPTQAHAQFGVKGGVNFAEIQGRQGEDASYKTYYHVGVLYQINLIGPLSIQPEVQYSLQGGTLKGAVTDYDTKLHYFTLPVLAKVTLGPVFVEAGPQFGVLVNATQNGKVQVNSTTGSAAYVTGDRDASGDFKSTDFSLCAGAGLKLGSSLSVGGRFIAGLNDINDVKTLTGINDPRLQNRVFQVYAAVQFGK